MYPGYGAGIPRYFRGFTDRPIVVVVEDGYRASRAFARLCHIRAVKASSVDMKPDSRSREMVVLRVASGDGLNKMSIQ